MCLSLGFTYGQLQSRELILPYSDLHSVTFKRVKHSLDWQLEPVWDMVTWSCILLSSLLSRANIDQLILFGWTQREHRKLLGITSCNSVVRAFLWVMDSESFSGRKVSYTVWLKSQEQQQHPLLSLPSEWRNCLSVRRKKHK